MPKERGYCMDWHCPARVSCRHHFGRSNDYAAMRGAPGDGHRIVELKMHRDQKKDSCPMYEYDRVKLWLIPKPHEFMLPSDWPVKL